METTEAIKIITTILNSMRENPAQFQFSVNVNTVGAMGVGGQGGHGIVSTANAPGSVGLSASASAQSPMTVEIAQQKANQEINSQFDKIDQILQTIISELQANNITNEKKDSFLGQLKSTWIPNVLINIVASVLSSVLLA